MYFRQLEKLLKIVFIILILCIVGHLSLNSTYIKVSSTSNQGEVDDLYLNPTTLNKGEIPMINQDVTTNVPVFDLHSDLLYYLLDQQIINDHQVMDDFIEDITKGNIKGSLLALYYPLDFNYDIDSATDQLSQLVKEQPYFNENFYLGFEGMRFIRNTEHLEEMYNKGFRFGALTWNEQNQYATGVGGSKSRGLTNEGIALVHKMEELGMLIDVSHANVQTFMGIANNTTKPFIASHSNVYNLCPHKRNLTDEQIKIIGERNGVIGVTSIKHFICTDVNKQNIAGMVDHIEYIRDLIGIDHVGLGFDYIDYLGDPYNIEELSNSSKTKSIIDELKKRNFSDEEIEKIVWKNALRVLKDTINN